MIQIHLGIVFFAKICHLFLNHVWFPFQSSKLSTNFSVLRVSWFLNLFSLHICRVQDRWTHIHSYQVWWVLLTWILRTETTKRFHPGFTQHGLQLMTSSFLGVKSECLPNWAEKWWNQNGHRGHPPQDDLILFKKLTKRFFRRPGFGGRNVPADQGFAAGVTV